MDKKLKSDRNRRYRRTLNGFINNIYRNQKESSKKRGHKLPLYSIQDLRDWCLSNPVFIKLFNDWKKSDYNKYKSPSLDRINDYNGYSFDNIRVTTWDNNLKKACEDRKNGVNNKNNKSVIKLSKENIFICEYHSMSEAARKNNVSKSVVFNSCKDGRLVKNEYLFKRAF